MNNNLLFDVYYNKQFVFFKEYDSVPVYTKKKHLEMECLGK